MSLRTTDTVDSGCWYMTGATGREVEATETVDGRDRGMPESFACKLSSMGSKTLLPDLFQPATAKSTNAFSGSLSIWSPSHSHLTLKLALLFVLSHLEEYLVVPFITANPPHDTC